MIPVYGRNEFKTFKWKYYSRQKEKIKIINKKVDSFCD